MKISQNHLEKHNFLMILGISFKNELIRFRHINSTETTENQALIILFSASYTLLLHTLIPLLEFQNKT